MAPRIHDAGGGRDDESEHDDDDIQKSEEERHQPFLGRKPSPLPAASRSPLNVIRRGFTSVNGSPSKYVPPRRTGGIDPERFSVQGLSSFSVGKFREAAASMLEGHQLAEGVYSITKEGIIHPYSMVRIRWDLIIGIIVLVQCFTIPYRVSFQLSASTAELGFWLDRLIDCLFIFDVYLNFRTGYSTDENLVEMVPSKVRWNYCKTFFVPDLVASIPYEFFIVIGMHITGSHDAEGKPSIYRAPQLLKSFRVLRVIKVVKLLRILRLLKIMARWESALYIKHSIASITKFFAFVIFIAHWGACCFHAVALETVFEGPPNWILYYEMQDRSDYERYIMAFYWSVSTVTTIGYGDIVPHSSSERLVAVIAMIVGCCVFAYGITNILEMVSHLNKEDMDFREKMDDINHYMRYRSLPADLRYRVREYIQHTRSEQHSFMSEARILKDLSPTIRYDVIRFVNRNIIEAIPLFESSDPAFVVELTKVLKAEYFAPGDDIVKEGHKGNKMYILAKGTVEVIKWDTFRVDVLHGNSYFGEMSLLQGENEEDMRRTATVRAMTYCDCRSLTKVDFKVIVANFPDVLEKMMLVVRERAEDMERKETQFNMTKPMAK